MAGGGKDKLEYVKQQEPKFLREFKARTNFKAGPTIETKKQKTEKLTESDVGEVREDEKPVICVLKDGDLTEEDYENYQKNKKELQEGDVADTEGKIIFKKPVKRTNEDASSRKVKDKEGKKSKQSKKSDNKNLLSFGEEEDY